MTTWQALYGLVSAIPIDDSFRTRAHTANGWTHLVCLLWRVIKWLKKTFTPAVVEFL